MMATFMVTMGATIVASGMYSWVFSALFVGPLHEGGQLTVVKLCQKILCTHIWFPDVLQTSQTRLSELLTWWPGSVVMTASTST